MINSNGNKRLWYLSGGMQKFGAKEIDKSNNWRIYLSQEINKLSEGNITVCNPNTHWSFLTDPEEYTDREIMNLDIYKLRNSELVIYYNNDPYSRGSMVELGIAWERRIPIIVVSEEGEEIHPWVKCMAEKILPNFEELLWYVVDHYININ